MAGFIIGSPGFRKVSVPSSSGRSLREKDRLLTMSFDGDAFQSPHLRGGPCGR